MENINWKHSMFKEGDKIKWPCPNCTSKALRLSKNKSINEETLESQEAHDHPDWGPEFIQEKFAGYLKCFACNDVIMFTGNSHLEAEMEFEPGDDRPQEIWKRWYNPTFFEPPLHFFVLKDIYPESVRTEILSSFKLFWCDLSSSANKIRVALEILMNEQGIKKTYLTRSRKRKNFNLHQRIEEFETKNKEVAEFLLAIKWVGNTGSHLGNLSHEDILEAYQLLEHSLLLLYDDKEVKLKKITKEINSRKGVRKRK